MHDVMKRKSRFFWAMFVIALLVDSLAITCVFAQEKAEGKGSVTFGAEVKKGSGKKPEYDISVKVEIKDPGWVTTMGYNISWEYLSSTGSMTFLNTSNPDADQIVVDEFTEYSNPIGAPSIYPMGVTKAMLDPAHTSSGTLNYQTMAMDLSMHLLATNSMFSSSNPAEVTITANGPFDFAPHNATDWWFDANLSSSLSINYALPSTVGGLVVPVDKFGLLAPYISLVSTIIIAAVATAVCIKRAKRRKEKQ